MNWVAGWLDGWTHPVCLIFIIIAAGFYLGKIRIGGISLDLSGVLVAALLFGIFLSIVPEWHIGHHIVTVYDQAFQKDMKFLSSFGTAIFISVIGISSGYHFGGEMHRQKIISFLIGAGMILLGMMLTMTIDIIDSAIPSSLLVGVFCGAMTSTPGLSAACEAGGSQASLATMGYGGAYLSGVIGIVLFVQIIARQRGLISLSSVDTEKDVPDGRMPGLYGLIQMAAAIVGGHLLGAAELPFSHFSLGNSGGILCAGILIGCWIARKEKRRRIPAANLSIFRGLGLVLFFVGSGVPAGVQFLSYFSLRCFLYGTALTLLPMVAGYGIALVWTAKKAGTALSVVCGGMTSTPAIGVLLRTSPLQTDLSAYSMAYTGALLTMVIGVRLLTA